MTDAATVRRFVCRACGRMNAVWSARCPNPRCLKLDGLVDAEILAAETSAIASPSAPTSAVSDPVPLSEVTSISARPRLTIARAPSPEPDLEDPVEELADVSVAAVPIPLSEVAETTFVRDSTGLPPLDHVLGGGLVVASVVLLASPPGVGKSSLTLQMLDGLGHRCLYVTGEETQEQVAATARRIGAASSKIYVIVERDLAKIFAHARAIRAQTIAIDSIQKMRCEDLDSRPGTTTQLRECTTRLVQYAKTTGTTLWLVGHVTADGAIAGPKAIEHDVDVVLELEQGAKFEGNERLLRCNGKNRFGPTNVMGRFELTIKGFVAVDADGWNEEL